MMGERGVSVDHSTIFRWVQKYAPEIEKRLRWQWRRPRSTSWRVDETYVKVRGRWAYLYRAVDKFGNTIDLYLSPTRNAKAAKRFLSKALNGLKDWEKPRVINTDKAPTYAAALAELKAKGKCPKDTQHRQVPMAIPASAAWSGDGVQRAAHCKYRAAGSACEWMHFVRRLSALGCSQFQRIGLDGPDCRQRAVRRLADERVTPLHPVDAVDKRIYDNCVLDPFFSCNFRSKYHMKYEEKVCRT
jgi:transposase-like protein